MYYLIEDSPNGLNVINSFYTLKEAEEKAMELTNNFCGYIVTKLV